MSVIRRLRHAVPARRRPRSRGQAVVEFALILPVFLLMTLGVVDVARVFTSYISLTNGVSSAALYAAQGSNFLSWCAVGGAVPCPTGTPATRQIADPGNIAYQMGIEGTGLTLSGIKMLTPMCTLASGGDVTCVPAAAGIYTNVKIAAEYNMTLLTPLVGNILGSQLKMTAATTAAILP